MKKILLSVSAVVLCLLVLLSVAGCFKERGPLSSALMAAGSNRPELEKVLEHYRDDPDPRKLKAAEYLIANMPGHYSVVPSPELDSVKAVLADLYAGKDVEPERLERWRRFYPDQLEKVYDVESITARYLINNIDMAFDEWDGKSWNKDLSFDDFCELLLPYRVGDEPLENWRTEYREHFSYITDSVYTGTDPIIVVNTVFDTIIDSLFKYNVDFSLPALGGDWLMRNRIGGCRESCDFTVYLLRSLGIAVATDCYFQDYKHTWNVVLDTTGRYEPFWLDKRTGSRAVRGGSDGRKKGKVYRWRYGSPDLDIRYHARYKDVTAEYFGKNRVSVKIDRAYRGKPVYLGFFRYMDLIPQASGPVLFGSAKFRDVEPDVAFVPVMGDGTIAGYPFYVLEDGEPVILIPDTEDCTEVAVKRKTQLTDRIKEYMDASDGALFEGSMTTDFSSPELLGSCRRPGINYNYIYLSDESGPFRYVRFTPAAGKELQMGEVRMFRDFGRQDTVRLSMWSYTEERNSRSDHRHLLDGDELSFYQSIVERPYFILDLGKSEFVRCIEWVPRNDDNFIRYGDTYELQYLDGARGWRTAGRQVARDTVLYFSGVPGNSLLRLHNVTRGVEESVFIWDDGNQKFL